MGRRTFGEAIPPSPREDLLMSEAPLQLSGKAVVSGGGRWVREYDLEETIDSSITLLVAVVVVVLLHTLAVLATAATICRCGSWCCCR
jgi:hypothetical protein